MERSADGRTEEDSKIRYLTSVMEGRSVSTSTDTCCCKMWRSMITQASVRKALDDDFLLKVAFSLEILKKDNYSHFSNNNKLAINNYTYR